MFRIFCAVSHAVSVAKPLSLGVFIASLKLVKLKSAFISTPSLLMLLNFASTPAVESTFAVSSPAAVSISSTEFASPSTNAPESASIASIDATSVMVSFGANSCVDMEASKSCDSLPSITMSVPSTVLTIMLLI